jgi:hypothetical protein
MRVADWLEANSDVSFPQGCTTAVIANCTSNMFVGHVGFQRVSNFVALTDFTIVCWGGVT